MSASSITCTADVGFDSAASSRLVGANFIVSSTKTGTANGQVNQQFGGALGGVTYLLQCVVVTSAPQHLSLWTHFSGKTPV